MGISQSSRDIANYPIATMGSHSALQILRGAKDEGFTTIAVCKRGSEQPYKAFKVADEIILVDEWKDFVKAQGRLISEKSILVPHASLIAYLGYESIEGLRVPYFGNKKIIRFESDRNLEKAWLESSGLLVPRVFKSPAEIDRPVIVKFHGAGGGDGYFLAKNQASFLEKASKINDKEFFIQEYVVGVPIYIHYFHSPLTGEVELMGFDRRYETNVDSLGRISQKDQEVLGGIDPSYLVVGNFPIVVRESYLPKILEMGEKVVESSKQIVKGGLFGPFCLETIFTPDGKIWTFEISARIVAGTNPYINGSPYTWLRYSEPMSTGRRIAREIKLAIQTGRLDEVVSVE